MKILNKILRAILVGIVLVVLICYSAVFLTIASVFYMYGLVLRHDVISPVASLTMKLATMGANAKRKKDGN